MLNLFIDTSYKYLTVAISEGDKIVASYCEECFKRQSEEVFMVLDDLFKTHKIAKKDISSVYITLGPGSYTGVRIALTIAKVFCSISKAKLYGISTLKLYAGKKEKCLVLMDARANRAYLGIYDRGECLLKDVVLPLDKIESDGLNVVLDGSLIGKENTTIDVAKNYIDLKDEFMPIEDIDHLTPIYLKESDAYYR